ncbi:MAG: ORF6N domain-containing protein [Candidatus Omnitrophica bacterium]|nr:ORF6N domain-containing protein [Candidatus Omnitrophota bacterium]
MGSAMSVEVIATRILEVRGKRVILDRDLAVLYDVKTKRLKEQVNRNKKRFPEDFMFQLTWEEATVSRSQIATLKQGSNVKYLPYAFTQEGIAMLSSVLNSERAIKVNIQIMRAFVKLKELLLTHKELAIKIDSLEKKYTDHDQKIKAIFEAIKKLLESPPAKERRIIGFCPPNKSKSGAA